MYKHILHATDLQENHFDLCKKAADLAKHHHATLYLLHIIEIPQSLLLAQNLGFTELAKPAKTDAVTVLRTLGEAFSIPNNHLFVEIGSPKHHIIEKAKQLKCQLIILGHHTSPTGVPGFLGSTTYSVMQHASCDVLTVNTP